MDPRFIRNFSIIAHIDHGKSTLADRFLEYTGAIPPEEMVEQFLDKMDIERERGITIKAQTVQLQYKAEDGNSYHLNLIDTPGHVDFSYEVSRSLAASEGALLLVDAAQGVEAQTLANAYLAVDIGLEIIPVINKIDLLSANQEKVKEEIEEVIGLDARDALLISAKKGIGIKEILKRIIRDIPPPKGKVEAPLKALVFDSWFDPYQGAVVLIRVFEGKVHKGMKIQLMSNGKIFEVGKVGVFLPDMTEIPFLSAGMVGFLTAGIKDVKDPEVGDTITDPYNPTDMPYPGFKKVKPMVFCGLYPTDTSHYFTLKDALEKLRLNDSSFTSEPETSAALGNGFRCGFLGLLHMEIIQERLEREFSQNLIITAPTVSYKVSMHSEELMYIENPSKLPLPHLIKSMEEPLILATIHTPAEFLGSILRLCQEKRGIQREVRYLSDNKVIVIYEIPLNEIVLDFYDRLKSLSKGYASLDYEFMGFYPSDLVKLDILINHHGVDALSLIVHRDRAYAKGKELVQRLKDAIPRQLFEVVIQASIGNKVIARESIKPLKKHVTGKCYGGDITRKRKLWEKQKEGKKRLKQLGNVEIPQEAFLAVLKADRRKDG